MLCPLLVSTYSHNKLHNKSQTYSSEKTPKTQLLPQNTLNNPLFTPIHLPPSGHIEFNVTVLNTSLNKFLTTRHQKEQ